MIATSKRKASYDLSFKLKAVKCAEEKTKEAAAGEFKVDPCRQDSWCPYVLVQVVAFTTLSFDKYDRSPTSDITQ